MKPLDTFAQELAHQLLGRHCGCYGDAFPAESCDEQAALCAAQIKSGVEHDKPARELAQEILVARCACYEGLHDDPESPENRQLCAKDLRETTETLQAAFDARATEIAKVGTAAVSDALGNAAP